MKKNHTLSHFVCHFYGFDRAFLCCSLLFLCTILLMFPLSALLKKLFPLIDTDIWFILSAVPFVLYYVGNILFAFYKAEFTEDRLILSWCGVRLKTIATEDLRLLCTVGDEFYDFLCLTCHTPQDLAQAEESDMVRSFITKDEVPFLKRKANYPDILARKRLLRLSKQPLLLLRKEKALCIPMDLILLQQIRELYPQLPYKNYSERKRYSKPYYGSKKYQLCLEAIHAYYTPEFTDDSIALYRGANVKRTIPLSTVQSIVRVDLFIANRRNGPNYLPLLFLSKLSIEEMAQKSKYFHASASYKAYKYAYSHAKYWTITTPDCCNLPCTEAVIDQLKVLCPNAQWLDFSDTWLSDSP